MKYIEIYVLKDVLITSATTVWKSARPLSIQFADENALEKNEEAIFRQIKSVTHKIGFFRRPLIEAESHVHVNARHSIGPSKHTMYFHHNSRKFKVAEITWHTYLLRWNNIKSKGRPELCTWKPSSIDIHHVARHQDKHNTYVHVHAHLHI